MKYQEIPGRPGLYQFDLQDVPCLPGEFRVVRWGLNRSGEDVQPTLANKLEDGVAAFLLISMKEDYHPRRLSEKDLVWMGTSLTRIHEDNRVSDNPIDEEKIKITLHRLQEKELVTVIEKDSEMIFFPTKKLIMKMIGNRRSLQKS